MPLYVSSSVTSWRLVLCGKMHFRNNSDADYFTPLKSSEEKQQVFLLRKIIAVTQQKSYISLKTPLLRQNALPEPTP